MAPPSVLSAAFLEWANPKLRAMADARYDDTRRDTKLVKWGELLAHHMEDYEQQPFAQPDFAGNLIGGKARFTSDELRERAVSYFRNHTRPGHLATLAAFEAQGGVSEVNPYRATSAMELWAVTEKERLRKLVCNELGMPLGAANHQMPPGFIGARKTVLKREFSMLPQSEQDEWKELARERKEAADREETAVITVQDRQQAFASWLNGILQKKMERGCYGTTMVFQFAGYWIGEEDRHLKRFRGQVSSTPTDRWHDSEEFKTHVSSAWTQFINRDAKDKIVFELTELKPDDTGDILVERRKELQHYWELLFRLYCDFAQLDVDKFWHDIDKNPADFVSPARLPENTRFTNPSNMTEPEFRAVYQHVRQCSIDRRSVPSEERFVFEQDIVNLWIAEERARHLKSELRKKNKTGAIPRNSDSAAGSTGDVDVSMGGDDNTGAGGNNASANSSVASAGGNAGASAIAGGGVGNASTGAVAGGNAGAVASSGNTGAGGNAGASAVAGGGVGNASAGAVAGGNAGAVASSGNVGAGGNAGASAVAGGRVGNASAGAVAGGNASGDAGAVVSMDVDIVSGSSGSSKPAPQATKRGQKRAATTADPGSSTRILRKRHPPQPQGKSTARRKSKGGDVTTA